MKSSGVSVTLTSDATIGGILIAILAVSIVMFFFYRIRRMTEVDGETINVFTLATELDDRLDRGFGCQPMKWKTAWLSITTKRIWVAVAMTLDCISTPESRNCAGNGGQCVNNPFCRVDEFELDVNCMVSPDDRWLASCQSGSVSVEEPGQGVLHECGVT
jgi:hypothetical protein